MRERFDPSADVKTFTDSDALEALDHIIRTKPAIIALQAEFSTSSRGTALVNRIKDDPALGKCELRVLARDEKRSRVPAKRGGHGSSAVAVDEPRPALDVRGTRRAPRIRIKDGVEVAVIPILLGGGLPLMATPGPRLPLKLKSHRLYKKTGTLFLEYDIEKRR